MIRIEPSASAYRIRLHVLLFNEGEYERAIVDFTTTLQLKLEDAKLYYQRAQAFAALDDYQHALADLDQAVRLEPKNIEAYQLRAQVHIVQDDMNAAIADLTEALRFDPTNAEIYEMPHRPLEITEERWIPNP